jgi:flagellar hook-associated protein 2
MPAFTLPGMASGQNTNEITRKLVEVEKAPIKRWEKENQFTQTQIDAWNDFKTLVGLLQAKTRNLTSITAPFSSKRIKASEDGIITGEATKSAKSAKRSLEVFDLATKHQIGSSKIPNTKKIDPGSFTVSIQNDKETVTFNGGSISDFQQAVRSQAKKFISSAMRIDEENSIITFTSQTLGKKGEMKIIDTSGILKDLGIVGDPDGKSYDKEFQDLPISKESLNPIDDPKFSNTSTEEGSPTLHENGFTLPSLTAYSLVVEPKKIIGEAKIEFKTTQEEKELQIVAITQKESDKKEFKTTVKTKDNSFTWELGKEIQDSDLVELHLLNPSEHGITIQTITWVRSEPFSPGGKPSNIITVAKDSRFKIDGVEVSRDRNENINDVLEGISFNLFKTTKDPITMDIDIDNKKGIELIKEFISAYNDIILYSKQTTSMDKEATMNDNKNNSNKTEDMAKDFFQNKSKNGVLAGDSSIMRLVGGLKVIASGNYPNRQIPAYKTLADIGVNSGDVGTSWQKIQDGLLQLDESKLVSALSENPDSVKELFSSDSDQDSRMDNGVGIKINDHLKPFMQFQTGIIPSKIKLLEGNIAENNKKIKSHETHLQTYEDKLKQRFLYMEQGVGKNKAVGSYLNQNLNRNRNND